MTRFRTTLLLSTILVVFGSHTWAEDIGANKVLIPVDRGDPFRINNFDFKTGIQIESTEPAPSVLRSVSDVSTEDVFASVGRGFNPILNQVLDKECIEKTQADDTLPTGAMIPFSDVRVVSNESQYADVSKSSFGFSAMIKAVSLGLGTASESSSTFNQVGQYARVYSRVVTQSKQRRSGTWTGRARGLLAGDEKARARFIFECGLSYVKAAYSGHLLDQTAEYNLNGKQNTTASATELEVGVGKVFGASASVSDAETQVNTISESHWMNHGRGAGAIAPSPLPGKGAAETMINFYNSGFIPAVKAAKITEGLPLYLTIETYRDAGLPLIDRIPTWMDGIMAAVGKKAEVYNTLVVTISDLEYALLPGPVNRLTAFYQGTTQDTATKNLVAAKKMLGDFQLAVRDCQVLMLNGKETTKDGPALSVCTDKLDKALPSAESITPFKLTRKFT
jgi:hypothetical protein